MSSQIEYTAADVEKAAAGVIAAEKQLAAAEARLEIFTGCFLQMLSGL